MDLCQRSASEQVYVTAAILELSTILSSIYEEFFSRKLPTVSLGEFITIWLREVKPQVKASTYKNYKDAAKHLCQFLGESRALLDISRNDITQFRSKLAAQLSAGSVNHYLEITRRAFKAAQRDELILRSPAEFVAALKAAPATPRAFTLEELQTVLAVADTEWRSMILCAVYTGQRLGDLSALIWSDVDLTAEEVRFVTAKTGARLVIPMAAPLRNHFLSLPSVDDPKTPFHPRAFRNFQNNTLANVSAGFGDLLAKAGLRPKLTHKKRRTDNTKKHERFELCFHSLRHTSVTLLKGAGIPHAAVEQLIGQCPAISRHYTHVDLMSLKRAANAFPEL